MTCHTFHMPCGPNSQAVARLGYFEPSSSALILHFCHSLRVCSSHLELSHMTHLTTIKAGARITSVFCSPLVPWDNFTQKNRLVLPMNSRKVKQEHLKYRSQACKAHERHDMSHYLHILSLSSLVKTRRYFYYIQN